jgi:putative DNA primase/helicase
MEDRAIVVELRRKLPSEKVQRFSVLDDQSEFKEIRRKLVRWAIDNRKPLGGARPQLPPGLNDRASDNWSPLLAIADLAGGEWGTRARAVALSICVGAQNEEQDIRFELLKDIRSIFDEEGGERCKALASASLVEKLSGREESPWATFNRGQPINPRMLGRMLKPFGIASVNLKIGHDSSTGRDSVAKGYKREAFRDAWVRYLGLPASCEEKGRDPAGNQEGGVETTASGDPRFLEGPQGEVADKCRYRYPNATSEERGKGAISEEKPP